MLEAVHQAAKGGVSTAGRGFIERDVLIYRRWTPPGQDQGEVTIDQYYPAHVGEQYCSWHMQLHWLVTWEERKPLSEFSPGFNGLMSSKMLKNSEEFCTTCTECQKTAPGKKTFAPLISLRIIEEPFQSIAMDLVGPLPRSRSGNKYILVICDYAMRHPEAIPLRSIDTEHIAEELVKVFSRMGVPKKILIKGATSHLAKVYTILHVQPINTSPYYP